MAELDPPGYDSDVYRSSEPEYTRDGCSSSYCSSEPGSESSRSQQLSRCSSDMSESLIVMSGCSGQDDDSDSSDSSVMEPLPDACGTTAWDSDNAFVLNDSKDTDMSELEVPSDHSDGGADNPEEFSSVLKESFFKLLYDGSNVVYIEAMILIFQYALK